MDESPLYLYLRSMIKTIFEQCEAVAGSVGGASET